MLMKEAYAKEFTTRVYNKSLQQYIKDTFLKTHNHADSDHAQKAPILKNFVDKSKLIKHAWRRRSCLFSISYFILVCIAQSAVI